MYAPKNKVLLSLDKKYTDEIILEGGLKLYLDPSFRPEWNVTCSGKIAALPIGGMNGLQIGDEVYFSFHVVNQRKFEDDKKFFVRNNLGNEFVREWTDKLGGTIEMVAFPGKGFEKKWAAKYVDEKGMFIDGCQGKEHEVENWMAKNFKYGYAQDMVYAHLLEIDGQDFWTADRQKIFAVKREGKLVAMPGICLAKEVRIDIGLRLALEKGIHLPGKNIAIPQDRGQVVTMGECTEEKLTVKEGDTVLFEPRFVEKYDFEGENHYVIRHRRILGVA